MNSKRRTESDGPVRCSAWLGISFLAVCVTLSLLFFVWLSAWHGVWDILPLKMRLLVILFCLGWAIMMATLFDDYRYRLKAQADEPEREADEQTVVPYRAAVAGAYAKRETVGGEHLLNAPRCGQAEDGTDESEADGPKSESLAHGVTLMPNNPSSATPPL